ncbi:MAG TPA: nucleotide exchange factor GrpE [Candidatus Ventrimonas merdavium]|nr:nucleotide exchange factor GrpE [Candidatus Ventrimonas merdavium]
MDQEAKKETCCQAEDAAEQELDRGPQAAGGTEPEQTAGYAGGQGTGAAGTERAGSAGAERTGETGAGADGQAEDGSAGADGEEAGSGKAKGAKKDPKDAQIEDLQDKLKRQMAEFDNFRKRTEKEKSAMYEIGARDIIEKILPVLDNFERAMAAVPEDAKGSSFAEGVEMIYKQFVKTLEDAGVEAIEAVGQPFDPNLHNAVMHIDDEQYGENEISQELQKGYKYRGTVVRHSMVQVAN